MEFVPYPKTPRLKRDIVVTEKLDGTNAQIVITPEDPDVSNVVASAEIEGFLFHMRVGSRNRWIAPGKHIDNYGFAGWCVDNQDELFKLGEGTHFGEWWGQGIARGYGMDRKVFSLFNTARWGTHNPNTPACVSVVPVLAHTQLDGVSQALLNLKLFGSVAAPGFFPAEGIIVYHSAAKMSFKVLLEGDDISKTEAGIVSDGIETAAA